MARLAFLILSALATLVSAQSASAGCGRALCNGQEPGGFYEAFVNNRRYFVSIPLRYSISKPAPLIVSYHAGSRDVQRQVKLDQFTNPKYNTDKLVVYPEGLSKNFTANDTEFTRSILNEVQDLYCIDKNRIFAAGKSQGAGLVGRLLACERTLSQIFAAFALVSPLLYTDVKPCMEPYTFPIPCSPGRTDVPIIEFHGGRDVAANYRGDYARRPGQCLPSVPWWIETWVRSNELDTKGNTTQLAADTPTTNITKYGFGDKEGLVTHVFDSELGHHWPSKSKNSDNKGIPAKFEATPMILDFFDVHPLNQLL
uniref:feruloyl esterase n=1 Tax=Bionectria ochroleuca TaxID=29856 RepID=A0A0B7JRU3_BIOOC